MFTSRTKAELKKALFAVFFILLLLLILPFFNTKSPAWMTAGIEHSYASDVRYRADIVELYVFEVIEANSTQDYKKLKQTYEYATDLIQTENLKAEEEYLKLDSTNKTINENYRVYLKESALVVSRYYAGEAPRRMAMQEAKDKLL
jgi:hypothetical protein